MSDSRLNQFLYAEYPNQRAFVSKLEKQKAEQTPESLADLWALTNEKAIAKAQELVEIGFFVEKGTTESPTFWVCIAMPCIWCKEGPKVTMSLILNFLWLDMFASDSCNEARKK